MTRVLPAPVGADTITDEPVTTLLVLALALTLAELTAAQTRTPTAALLYDVLPYQPTEALRSGSGPGELIETTAGTRWRVEEERLVGSLSAGAIQ